MADTGEPFGLPGGTVRGTIALAFTAAFIYMGIVGTVAPETLLALGGPAIGYYFATRQTETQVKAEAEAKVAAEAEADVLDPPFTGQSPD